GIAVWPYRTYHSRRPRRRYWAGGRRWVGQRYVHNTNLAVVSNTSWISFGEHWSLGQGGHVPNRRNSVCDVHDRRPHWRGSWAGRRYGINPVLAEPSSKIEIRRNPGIRRIIPL